MGVGTLAKPLSVVRLSLEGFIKCLKGKMLHVSGRSAPFLFNVRQPHLISLNIDNCNIVVSDGDRFTCMALYAKYLLYSLIPRSSSVVCSLEAYVLAYQESSQVKARKR